MRTLFAFVVVAVALMTCAGCAQSRELARVQRENAELRSRVALLESQVAELKDQRTPITVNGLTLTPLDAPLELKLTPSPLKLAPPREGFGVGTQGRLVLSGAGTTFKTAGVIEMAGPRAIGDGVGRRLTTTKAAATTRTTTTTPAK